MYCPDLVPTVFLTSLSARLRSRSLIEAAKEAIFEFNSEREELFFGMSKGNLTGDMVKRVVNKGVETLINTTEVIMTNNFAGMTTQQAAKEITAQIVVELNGQGLNIKNNGLGF